MRSAAGARPASHVALQSFRTSSPSIQLRRNPGPWPSFRTRRFEMPEDTSGSNPNPTPGESPGGKPMGAWGIALVTVYLVFVAIVVFHSLVVLWPPNREDENKDVTDRLARI